MRTSCYLKIILGGILIISSLEQKSIAGCSAEIRILGDDLIGKTFTSHETHLLSQRILRAKQYCFRGDEEESINAINSARELAGLKPTTGTFDWENVPIEEIIKDPAY